MAYSPDSWEPVCAALLACKFAGKNRRCHYSFRRLMLPDWQDRVPQGYEMAPIDSRFLARQDLTDGNLVRDRITEWTDFTRDGFGYCLLHGGTIVSHCITDCVSGNACEVGIGTHPAYRRRGLGAITATATIEYALLRGLPEIGWHCFANNIGSRRVAETVGFELDGEYDQYSNGPVAANAGDLTPDGWCEHAEFFERASGVLSRDGARMAWYAAAARAVGGEPGRALALLRRAVDSGTLPRDWKNWLEEAWEFQSLKTEPGWVDLISTHGEVAEEQ